jgi:hypothetical protein
MKNPNGGTNSGVHIIALTVATLALLFILTMAWADDYSQLKGYWQCQEEGETATLEFKSRQQLLHNGEAYNYWLAPGAIQVQEGADLVNYFFRMEGEVLVILSADGSVTQCQRATKPKQAASKQKSDKPATPSGQAQSDDPHWPPPYVRPQGGIDEDNPGAQALLYKFAGRWDHVTSNTLTNLFLKPDGTYEEAYESGYSGEFKDQGGYQTGDWGATGAQQGRGRWKVVGGLRKGKLYLVDQNGKESVYHYEVHIRGGEIFWGEYFFNGQFYSVKYIYR